MAPEDVRGGGGQPYWDAWLGLAPAIAPEASQRPLILARSSSAAVCSNVGLVLLEEYWILDCRLTPGTEGEG